MNVLRHHFVTTALLGIILVSCCIGQSTEKPAQPVTREGCIPEDAVKATPDSDLYPPILHNDEWEEPIPVPGVVNTPGAEDSPFVLPGGDVLFFWFTPDVDVPPQEQLLDGITGIYVSWMVIDQWDNPERIVLQDPDDLALDGCVVVQGSMMWFCSCREDNYREIDIYTAEFKDGKWINWKNVGEKLNCEYEIGELHISSDGNELYFHSKRSDGKGGYDIWITTKINGEWQEPENVRAVNTSEDEGWPFLTVDGEELWFTRTYEGTPGIFRSKRVDGEWSEPEVIISQFAGEPSLDAAGNIYFVHHFFKDGTMIESDIYVAYRKGTARFSFVSDCQSALLLTIRLCLVWFSTAAIRHLATGYHSPL
jgi:hypothetical protein